MTVWLLARALAEPGALKRIPRRLVYVVDRRAVVDQATAEAEKLLKAPEGEDARARELKTKLRPEKDPLPISTLRGRHVDNRD